MSKRSTRPSTPVDLAPVKRPFGQLVLRTLVCLGFLGLLLGGVIGRNAARTNIRVADLADLTEQIQHQIDLAQPPLEQVVAPTPLFATNRIWAPSYTPQATAAANALKTRLAELDSESRPSSVVELELRVGRATLANFERRYSNALEILATIPRGSNSSEDRRIRILQLEGDSRYGLGHWRDAAALYEQVLKAKPHRVDLLSRIAECFSAIGDADGARRSVETLATRYRQRGDSLLIQGDATGAQASFDKAITIQDKLSAHATPATPDALAKVERARTRRHRGYALMASAKLAAANADFEAARALSTNQRPPPELPASSMVLEEEHAACAHACGDALMGQGKLDDAIEMFASALVLRARLVEQAGRTVLAGELARSHQNRGNALLIQAKPDAALTNFDLAVRMLTPLIETGARPDLRDDLSRCLNNRGVALRAAGKAEESQQAFESALAIATRPLGAAGERGSAASAIAAEGEFSNFAVNLEFALSHTETAVEALVRNRILDQEQPKELTILQGVILRNRGYARLVLGKLDSARLDFDQSAEIFTRLEALEGHRDLAPQVAKSLGAAAWLRATCADSNLRDGRKAITLAQQACVAADWKSAFTLETLAAACAETGDFAAAARWQAKASELSPANRQEEARRRLGLYQAGKPFRANEAQR